MPSQWTIDLVGIKPHQVRNSGIHRFLSAWFAETGTDHRDLKAYSLRERLDHRDGVRLTLGVIADRLAPLISAIPVGQPIQFGDNPGRVATVGVAPSCRSPVQPYNVTVRVGDPAWVALIWRIDGVMTATVFDEHPGPDAVAAEPGSVRC